MEKSVCSSKGYHQRKPGSDGISIFTNQILLLGEADLYCGGGGREGKVGGKYGEEMLAIVDFLTGKFFVIQESWGRREEEYLLSQNNIQQDNIQKSRVADF